MNSSPGMFVGARRQSLQDHSRSHRQSRVAFGARGSGLPILSRYILDGPRIEAGRGFPVDLSRPAPAMDRRWLSDGRARGALGVPASPGPVFTSRWAASPGGARFHRARCGRGIARIRAKHTFLKPLTVPARQLSEPGTRRSMRWGSWSFYSGARGICRMTSPIGWRGSLHGAEKRALQTSCRRACETTAAKHGCGPRRNLELTHPGVLKYFREIGGCEVGFAQHRAPDAAQRAALAAWCAAGPGHIV